MEGREVKALGGAEQSTGKPLDRKFKCILSALLRDECQWHQDHLVGARGILGASQNSSTFDNRGQHFISVSIALSGREVKASSWVPYRGQAVSVPFLSASTMLGLPSLHVVTSLITACL